MAIIGNFRDARIEVNGVNLSDHFSEVSITTARDENEITGFGATYHVLALGLGDATITGTVMQDFAGGSVDATLWPLSSTDTPFTVKVRPTTGTISPTNPEYVMTSLMSEYTPISGTVGSPLSSPVTFKNAAQTGLVRNTS